MTSSESATRVYDGQTPAAVPAPVMLDEALVADVRAELTPAQMVERKVASLLKDHALPVSQLTTRPRRCLGR